MNKLLGGTSASREYFEEDLFVDSNCRVNFTTFPLFYILLKRLVWYISLPINFQRRQFFSPALLSSYQPSLDSESLIESFLSFRMTSALTNHQPFQLSHPPTPLQWVKSHAAQCWLILLINPSYEWASETSSINWRSEFLSCDSFPEKPSPAGLVQYAAARSTQCAQCLSIPARPAREMREKGLGNEEICLVWVAALEKIFV